MTNLEALMAECEPFTASPVTYSKKLADADIIESATYTSAVKKDIAKCAVAILVAMLPLSSDNTGRTSQSYNREGLESRIKQLCKENGFDETEFFQVPMVEVYPNMF